MKLVSPVSGLITEIYVLDKALMGVVGKTITKHKRNIAAVVTANDFLILILLPPFNIRLINALAFKDSGM